MLFSIVNDTQYKDSIITPGITLRSIKALCTLTFSTTTLGIITRGYTTLSIATLCIIAIIIKTVQKDTLDHDAQDSNTLYDVQI
jgi:hypothetical protein